MVEEGKVTILATLGIVAIVAIIGLVLLFKGSVTGAVGQSVDIRQDTQEQTPHRTTPGFTDCVNAKTGVTVTVDCDAVPKMSDLQDWTCQSCEGSTCINVNNCNECPFAPPRLCDPLPDNTFNCCDVLCTCSTTCVDGTTFTTQAKNCDLEAQSLCERHGGVGSSGQDCA